MKTPNLFTSGVLLSLAVLCLVFASDARAQNGTSAAPAHSHFWELGAGEYGSGADANDTWGGSTLLDKARFDWVFVLFGNENPTGKDLNRLLKINPDLKFLIRVWPILSQGGSPANSGMGTFLDYLYAPGTREKILVETSKQVHQIMDTIEKPQNVMGFVFLEELPMHFTDLATYEDGKDPTKLTWDLKKYQKQIEAERGKPLVWDDETRLWWGKKFTQVLNEINAHIKKESGKKVFVYFQGNNTTLDFHPQDVSISTPQLLPFHYSDIIKPGVADGFFVYPNVAQGWKTALDLAAKNNWLVFSQLSHPSSMRAEEWAPTLARVKEKHPNNLGYFFFCGGNCLNQSWGDDPAIAATDNEREKSAVSHHRSFGAREKIGMKIIERELSPQIQVQYNSQVKPGETVEVMATVQNRCERSWFSKDDDAILKNVKLRMEAPLEYSVSTPGTINIGDLKPGASAKTQWRLKVKKPVMVSAQKPLKIIFTADNSAPFTMTAIAGKQSFARATSVVAEPKKSESKK